MVELQLRKEKQDKDGGIDSDGEGVGGEGVSAEVKGFQFLTISHVSLHEGNRDNHV